MSFYEHLKSATDDARRHLLTAPVVADCLQGRVAREDYLAFLGQAYHHVRHTTPLLMSLGGRLPERLSWLRPAVAEYIEEEIGHEEWILNDIAAAGGDAAAVRMSRPGLPAAALTYLRSHGTLDQEHTRHLERLLERMEPEDQADVVRAARVFFKLYGDIFRALPAGRTTWN